MGNDKKKSKKSRFDLKVAEIEKQSAMNNNELKKLQSVEFEILKMIDEYCKKFNVQYSLYAGTALGAVRHKGFIPWDDDVDIAMERDEFNRFCYLWKKHPVTGYTLSCLQYDESCAVCHAKVHKDNTVLLSKGEIESIGHHGIWLDIFPLDRVGDQYNQKTVFRKATELIILARANTRSTIDTPQKRIVRGIISLIPKSIRRKRIRKILKWITENNRKQVSNYNVVDLSATYVFNYKFPEGMTEQTRKIEFNGYDFTIYNDYDQMLSTLYGNYMQLPPEKERVYTHNPVKLQF